MENEEFLKIIHGDVIKCIKDVGKAHASIKINYVRLKNIDTYVVKCDDRLADLELWKAEHDGEVKGKKSKFDLFNTKTVLICTVGALIISALAFYYTSFKPTVEVTAGLIKKVDTISQNYEKVLSQLD